MIELSLINTSISGKLMIQNMLLQPLAPNKKWFKLLKSCNIYHFENCRLTHLQG